MAIRILSEAEHMRTCINNDPELKLIGRHVSMNMAMEIGADKLLFHVREGEIKEIRPVLPMIDSIDIYLKAEKEDWEKLLAPVPPPRFQNLKAAMRAKNCEISGNVELYSAYFPAINRIIDVMRELQNAG